VQDYQLLQIARERALLRVDEPPTDPGVALCTRVWSELEGTRAAWGQALGPIPWPAIDAWCSSHGYDGDTRDLVVAALDAADCARAEREQAKRALDNATGGKR
jgi:hypothetical protein